MLPTTRSLYGRAFAHALIPRVSKSQRLTIPVAVWPSLGGRSSDQLQWGCAQGNQCANELVTLQDFKAVYLPKAKSFVCSTLAYVGTRELLCLPVVSKRLKGSYRPSLKIYHQLSLGVVPEQHLTGFHSRETKWFPSSSYPAGIHSERAVRIPRKNESTGVWWASAINP
jgi:hypothetical protein